MPNSGFYWDGLLDDLAEHPWLFELLGELLFCWL